MDNQLFERFLYESESDSLDFKVEQYKFIGAKDDDKGELLKDILAFVNSWRRIDAYIVIGIHEQPEKPNILKGISTHIDDASIQQFVNSKTNQPCSFSYRTYTYNNMTFGVIHIPLQQRPIYLTKSFGGLFKDTVYVRRGSSTDIAKPDEIAKMTSPTSAPNIDIQFIDNNNLITKQISKKVIIHEIADEIPVYVGDGSFSNRSYYKELFDHYSFVLGYTEVSFHLVNKGDSVAKNIDVEITIDWPVTILLQRPIIPIKTIMELNGREKPFSLPKYNLKKIGNDLQIKFSNPLLHAQQDFRLDTPIFLRPGKSGVLPLQIKIFCEGSATPFVHTLEFECPSHEILKLDWEAYLKWFEEKFKVSL